MRLALSMAVIAVCSLIQGCASGPAMDPVSSWDQNNPDASIRSLEHALANEQPLLPANLGISEEQFAEQYVSLSREDQKVFMQSFLDQHDPLRYIAREIRDRAEEAYERGDEQEAERLRMLLVEWGNALDDERYTVLTQMFGQIIAENGEREF